MVGKLDTQQTALLLALMAKMKRPEYFLRDSTEKDENEGENVKKGAAFLLKKVKRKIDIKIVDEIPVIKISLDFAMNLDEMKWNESGEEQAQNIIEQKVAKQMKSEYESMIKYLQETGSDPVGVGNMIRAKNNSYWKEHNWKEIYKNCKISVDIKTDIKQFGVIE
jgi:spore germination protein